MQPCNGSHTMGSRYLGYRLVLYTPIICHPIRILGNDYPGMGIVVRLHEPAVRMETCILTYMVNRGACGNLTQQFFCMVIHRFNDIHGEHIIGPDSKC